MKLVSVKLSKKDKKEMMKAPAVLGGDYPWGLRITLDEDQLSRLEHLAGYKADDEILFMAKGKIVGIRSNDTSGGKKDRSIEIQLTSIGCERKNASEGMTDSEWMKRKRGYK